mmetsp:Transcript_24174/g.65463  ORF Transcript_24174/g.65463 Transcript_24174/m.65463 type:complete len:207 (+) Transcript_24174:242-862(+)
MSSMPWRLASRLLRPSSTTSRRASRPRSPVAARRTTTHSRARSRRSPSRMRVRGRQFVTSRASRTRRRCARPMQQCSPRSWPSRRGSASRALCTAAGRRSSRTRARGPPSHQRAAASPSSRSWVLSCAGSGSPARIRRASVRSRPNWRACPPPSPTTSSMPPRPSRAVSRARSRWQVCPGQRWSSWPPLLDKPGMRAPRPRRARGW